MAKTNLLSVAQTPTKTPIIAQSNTKSIEIAEDPSVASYPTTAFEIRAPLDTDDPIRFATGTSCYFEAPHAYFPAGTVVGYVSAITGATTFKQFEQGF